jgi:hypothetical protein
VWLKEQGASLFVLLAQGFSAEKAFPRFGALSPSALKRNATVFEYRIGSVAHRVASRLGARDWEGHESTFRNLLKGRWLIESQAASARLIY